MEEANDGRICHGLHAHTTRPRTRLAAPIPSHTCGIRPTHFLHALLHPLAAAIRFTRGAAAKPLPRRALDRLHTFACLVWHTRRASCPSSRAQRDGCRV